MFKMRFLLNFIKKNRAGTENVQFFVLRLFCPPPGKTKAVCGGCINKASQAKGRCRRYEKSRKRSLCKKITLFTA